MGQEGRESSVGPAPPQGGASTPAPTAMMPGTLACPTYGTQHAINRGADGRVLPDVPELRPLDAWVHAHDLGLHRFMHTKVCRHRSKRILPESALGVCSSQPESYFIHRIVASHQHHNLGYCATIFIFVGAKGDPPGKHMPFRVHERKGLFIA
jgi:hypothetical protein